MDSPRSPERVSYASVTQGYTSPSEQWSEYQTMGDVEATAIALAESLNDSCQVIRLATVFHFFCFRVLLQ